MVNGAGTSTERSATCEESERASDSLSPGCWMGVYWRARENEGDRAVCFQYLAHSGEVVGGYSWVGGEEC